MFEKLSETEKNYEKIAEDLSTPEVAADPERFAKLMREHKRLTPIVDKYREYVRLKSQVPKRFWQPKRMRNCVKWPVWRYPNWSLP